MIAFLRPGIFMFHILWQMKERPGFCIQVTALQETRLNVRNNMEIKYIYLWSMMLVQSSSGGINNMTMAIVKLELYFGHDVALKYVDMLIG